MIGGADERDLLAGLECKREAVERGSWLARVRGADTFQRDPERPGRGRGWVGWVAHRGIGGGQLEDSSARGVEDT